MKSVVTILVILQTIWVCFAPPVTKSEQKHPKETNQDPMDFIHYNKYLKQVVSILESDAGFKEKLEQANEEDIKSGKIAHELDFVSHHVRTQLDELKRVELERLIDLKHQLQKQGFDENLISGEPLHGHLDRSNKHTFEIEDLKKLITKTTEDLAEVDQKRREEFKQYEMEKEAKKLQQLEHANNVEERAKLEKEFKEQEEKHKKHEPLHEPGHKPQLEEVWQEQDQMQQKFEPKVFFALHDTNSDGYWDQKEVAALFIHELNKMYEAGAPEDDLRERHEEMERMREAVFKEMDHDADGFISEKEFIKQTKRKDFEEDHGWKGIDEQGRPYTDEELQEYVRQQPGYHLPPGAQHLSPPGGYHPNEVPQGYGQPAQYYQGQPPPQYQQYAQAAHHQQGQQAPLHYQQVPNPPPPAQHYPPVNNPPVQGAPIPNLQQQPEKVSNEPLPPSPIQHQQQPPVQNQPLPPANSQVNVNQPNEIPHEAGKLPKAN